MSAVPATKSDARGIEVWFSTPACAIWQLSPTKADDQMNRKPASSAALVAEVQVLASHTFAANASTGIETPLLSWTEGTLPRAEGNSAAQRRVEKCMALG